MTTPVVVHVIVASFNRREQTVKAVARLLASQRTDLRILITVFDDGSSDGTNEVLREKFPQVNVLRGNGDCYWATSMAAAERSALDSTLTETSDYLLWLNDDVVLRDDSVHRAIVVARHFPKAIVVGAMQDDLSRTTSYSGLIRPGRHPLRLRRVEPSTVVQRVDTFNGNFVLVPFTAAKVLGGIDGKYSHAWADLDYGYRARSLGFEVVLMPGYAGDCSRNARPPHTRIRSEWQAFVGPKGGGNPRSLSRFLRRHGGAEWPAYFAITYGLWFARSIRLLRR